MKQYDKAFKQQTVQMIQEEGKTVSRVSQDFGISANTLYWWVSEYKQAGKKAFPGSGQLKADNQKTRDLEKRISDLEEEDEILKKPCTTLQKTGTDLFLYS